MNVRIAFRWVSASGQSQAVSMCAWPIGATSWAVEAFRRSYSPARMSAVSASGHTLQKRLSSDSSLAGPGLVEARSSSRGRRSVSKSKASRHASGSNRPSSQRWSSNGDSCDAEHAVAGELDLEPKALVAVGRLAASTASWWWRFSPCAGTPSSQSVASLAESQRRSTRLPLRPGGTVAAPRNQYVAHSGPNRSPSSAGR